MAERSAIEWTGATWNPVRARRRDTGKVGWHCEHVSEGCRNCYAETFNARGLPNGGTGLAYRPGHRDEVEIFLDETMLLQPLRWRKPRKIFVGSMTDLFADFVTNAMLDRVFAVMALCPQHTFQVLTKRPERMRAYLDGYAAHVRIEDLLEQLKPNGLWNGNVVEAAHILSSARPLPNVWLGTSCENRPAFRERWAHVAATPTAVRFMSAEPLLGDLGDLDLGRVGAPNWIIVGGESGPRARPMHPDWARSIRDQCAAAGVAFFFKQWGAFAPQGVNAERWLWRPDGSCRPDPLPEGLGRHAKEGFSVSYRVGKKAAGRLLDGAEHNGMPVAGGGHG